MRTVGMIEQIPVGRIVKQNAGNWKTCRDGGGVPERSKG